MRRNPERTNRNRIEGRCDGVSQLWMAWPDSRLDIATVNPAATGGKISVLPREISAPLGRIRVAPRRREAMGVEKSAEAIVAGQDGR